MFNLCHSSENIIQEKSDKKCLSQLSYAQSEPPVLQETSSAEGTGQD